MSNTVTTLDQSLFHPGKYQLTFDRIANTVFYCTQCNLPGLMLAGLPQPTPLINLKVPSNKLEFEPLVVTFMVDDQLRSWNDIFNWMTGLSGSTTDNYKNLANTAVTKSGNPLWGVRPPYSDGTLTLYTAKNNAQIRYQFYDCWPTSLSPLQFDYSKSADEQLVAQASFIFSFYTQTQSPA